MEITDTFVLIAPDSTATCATIPIARAGKKTVPLLQYELLTITPYKLTLDELIFQVHVARLELSAAQIRSMRTSIWTELFSKSHPCMRASALPKKYGFGVHHDHLGRIALHPVESATYKHYAAGRAVGTELVYAMRTRRE